MTFVLCLWGACSSRVDAFPLKGWLLERGSMHLSHGITEMSNIQIIEYGCAPIKFYQQKQERGRICPVGSILPSSEWSLV